MASQQPSIRIGVTLSGDLQARLSAHCAASRESAGDVIADALDLHLDGLEGARFDPADVVQLDESLAGLVAAAAGVLP